jgi:nitroreductase
VQTYEAITTRRSIRRYMPEPVSEDLIQELLTAGMSGPSAHNRQPWQFVVVTDEAQLNALADIQAYRSTLSDAVLAIVVCGDMGLALPDGTWMLDCAVAVQNMLLLAHDRGLGAVWLECHYREERAVAARAVLGLPDHIQTLAVVAVGHPAEEVGPTPRYQPERVHRDRW